jgi:protein-S-isoprenylcysteine O-methyltransferase Ste14
VTPALAALWIAFVVYWGFAALRTATRTQATEDPRISLVSNAALVVAGILLFAPRIRLGQLDGRIYPPLGWIAVLGLVLTAAGLALCVWARQHLGRNWSVLVALKVNHQLIRSGPYMRLRHPIYTGILLATFGTALSIGQYRALAGVVLFFAGFVWKARREERLLRRQFGPEFDRYERETGMLLPRRRR